MRPAHRPVRFVLAKCIVEPLADRMIHRRNPIVITGLDSPGVNVTCDAGRFRCTRRD